MGKKRYIPKTRHNPEVQAKKIEKSREDLIKIQKTLEALSASHDNHISYLGNFARHDIKNSIQSMDSILSTTNAEEFNDEHIQSLKANLKVIRETMDNFSKLVPYSKDEKFNLKNLIIAVELLTRNDLHKNKIKFKKILPSDIDIYLNLPFQSVLQMFNNLIINSIKALENIGDPAILIEAHVKDGNLIIELSDNGRLIDEKEFGKIFEFGHSTTGGSGIGLYHAKYLCELFSGKIEVKILNNDYSKTFLVHLPILN
ncbi:HAMP domain-containing histidine kinase [Elizabethkingia anophelis]|uniref:sensor histidine kinase n=1 Tax=Elizabethkingia anophelis TaxID=1117645 RepID=UPI0020B45D81|nr:HAMP domain-containing sensor histidine kinase [Elizabethkingia anophelis]UTF93053.1 HAMP domain-containing histidine kinase [Elizabethkingia anophelis]